MHAFIDGSVRDQRHLLCMTLVAPAQLSRSRRELNTLLLPGAREPHFKKEKETPPQAADRPDRTLEAATTITWGHDRLIEAVIDL
ncbi:hypothetical protein [Amycolatopsis sp. cmx-11-51]|uniref:hypothetical protein n=1 Tax=Amycolatopsis sp. cmx-11-51 TaxID=2785797 RepID=UPI0039E475C6